MAAMADGALEPEPEGDYELSPEEWQGWEVFDAMWTNWNVVAGLGGAYREGLNYAALPAVMGFLQVPRNKRRNVFWMVRILEDEAKKHLNKP